jgi:signal transduction histidine kinase
MDWRELQVALRGRVKELTCLYGIARLVARADTSLDVVLQNAVNLLPPAWLYPEIAAAEISFDNRVYQTPNTDNIVQRMSANIIIDDITRGKVEVGYTSEKPPIDEGPFLVEERNLIDTIANELAFIIEQKLHSEEKQRLQSQLRRADRLATIGKLAAGVAHEINEPLSNILGFAQLAGKDAGILDQTKKDVDKIIAATLHARDIIKDLLTFAREAEPVKVNFNLNDLIKDGLYFLEARFVKAGINLICDLSSDLPDIMADRSQMLQVLTNLVVNSVQAMPDGGKLTITTAGESKAIFLTVEDTGIGMDKETLNKIFNPFFTTKDINEGTGLGLSVVHGIVTSHGGEIDVRSRQNQGTRFRIKFPLSSTSQNNNNRFDRDI